MAKLYATEAAQRVIDTAVQLHGGDGVRRGHLVERLYREIRALRIYEGASDVQKIVIARSDSPRRSAEHGTAIASSSARRRMSIRLRATTCRRSEQWPDILLDAGISISRVAQRRRRTDRPTGRARLRRSHRADRQRPPAHLQGAGRLVEPLAHALVENYGIKPGNRILIRSGNNPAHGRGLACGDQGRRGGRQHHADAARRRTDQDRRQGARSALALMRQRIDGRTRRLRQGQPIPQAGDRLRRHLQPRRRARPHRARQVGQVRCR